MDQFSLTPEKKVNRKPLIWNILTIVVLLGVCCLLVFFLNTFINPYNSYNPFPPEPLPTRYVTDTPTSTIIPLPPTWTSTPTIKPSATRTRAPTWTLLPGMITPSATETPTATATQGTPTVTNTPMPAVAEIKHEASTTTHPDLACNWMGVGGKVVKADGESLPFQTIQLGGTLDGQTIGNRTAVSGSATAYGAS
ncbi:MAG: hypothetical protein HGA82_02890, partial [Anaerolineales bacterium]|nr:hypothetical protein [Anaerolineales bacterium]